jgi:hypothetical protein
MNPTTQMLSQRASALFPEVALAYVKPVSTDKGQAFAVCSSEGEMLALFPTQDAAFFAAKQHELEPMLLH